MGATQICGPVCDHGGCRCGCVTDVWLKRKVQVRDSSSSVESDLLAIPSPWSSGRNPASEIPASMREWKVKAPVSVYIRASKHATVGWCHLRHDCRRALECRTGSKSTVANLRGPCSGGLVDLSVAGPGVASCQRGLVPHRTGTRRTWEAQALTYEGVDGGKHV